MSVTFLADPVLVTEETGAAAADWTRFDAGTHVPYDAQNVYLRAWALADGAATQGSIEYRPNTLGASYSIVATGLVETTDQNSESVSFVEMPLDPQGRGFEWRTVVTGDLTWKLEIVGYTLRPAPPEPKRHN